MNELSIRFALSVAALAALTGCGSVENLLPHPDPNASSLGLGANPPIAAKPVANPSEKVKVLPVARQDISCPTVDIAEGGAAARVGGADNASVRYQFNIADTARECDPAGPGQASLKIGVSGHVVIGPAGAAGTFSAPLKITVTNAADKKDVFSKTYKVEATTDGVTAGAFRVVTEPIPLPMTTLQLADEYSITVGFTGGGGGGAPPPRRHRQKKSAS
jgi:hypothetical protein